MTDYLRGRKVTFYDLIVILIEKKALFYLDANRRTMRLFAKNGGLGGVLAYVTFSDPPLRNKNVYVPPRKLEELSRCLGIA